ncbi:MAG: hypothetical protein R3A52_01695 [Polyangiales bacterium]
MSARLALLLALTASCASTPRPPPPLPALALAPAPAPRAVEPAPSLTSSRPAPRVDAPPIAIASDGEAIGPAAPTLFHGGLDAMAPDGRWMVVAQAREDLNHDGAVELHRGREGRVAGDVAWHLLGRDTDVAIDAWVASDPRGRYAVYLAGGALWLRDTVAGGAWELSHSCTIDEARRVVSFDHAGERLLYAHHRDGDRAMVVRSLPDGEERAIDPGGAWQYARIDAWGGLVLVVGPRREGTRSSTSVVLREGEHPWEPPWPLEMEPDPDPEARVASSRGGVARVVEGLVSLYGENVIAQRGHGLAVQTLDGALVHQLTRDGSVRFVYADPTHDTVILGETSERERVLRYVGGVRAEERRVCWVTFHEAQLLEPTRFVQLDVAGEQHLDVERGVFLDLDDDESPRDPYGSRFPTSPRFDRWHEHDVRHETHVRDTATGEAWRVRWQPWRERPGDHGSWGGFVRRFYPQFDGTVLDLQTLCTMHDPRDSAAISETGRVLRPARMTRGQVLHGPLRWEPLRWTGRCAEPLPRRDDGR